MPNKLDKGKKCAKAAAAHTKVEFAGRASFIGKSRRLLDRAGRLYLDASRKCSLT